MPLFLSRTGHDHVEPQLLTTAGPAVFEPSLASSRALRHVVGHMAGCCGRGSGTVLAAGDDGCAHPKVGSGSKGQPKAAVLWISTQIEVH